MDKQLTHGEDKMTTAAATVNEINELLPPTNAEYPIAFLRGDDICVTAESSFNEIIGDEIFTGCSALDYWENFMCRQLSEYLEANELGFEWENAGGIVVFDDSTGENSPTAMDVK